MRRGLHSDSACDPPRLLLSAVTAHVRVRLGVCSRDPLDIQRIASYASVFMYLVERADGGKRCHCRRHVARHAAFSPGSAQGAQESLAYATAVHVRGQPARR